MALNSEYTVVYSSNIDTLIAKVNRRLKDGWGLVGYFNTDNRIFYQAMLKQSFTVEVNDEKVLKKFKKRRGRE